MDAASESILPDPTVVRSEIDVVLETLLDTWAWASSGQTLTVICGGVLVTGQPIRDDVFGELLAQTMERGAKTATVTTSIVLGDVDEAAAAMDLTPEEAESLMRSHVIRMSDELGNLVRNITKKQQEDTEAVFGGRFGSDNGTLTPRPFPRFTISLANARMYQSGYPVVEAPIWRGRLDAVSSWWIGTEDGETS